MIRWLEPDFVLGRLLFPLLVWFAALPAAAGTRVATERMTAALVADRAVAAPGETLSLAFVQEIAPGWHTYWINPGDSGAPATFAWKLQDGAEIGPTLWPAPEAIPYFGLMSFGFHDRLVLLHELRIPAEWPSGSPLPVRLQADWLVCAEICIPESGEFELLVPIGTTSLPAGPGITKLVEEARSALPRESPWPVGFTAEGTMLRLKAADLPVVERLGEARFFAYDPTLLDHVAEPTWRQSAKGLVLDLVRRADSPLAGPVEGVLVLTENLPDGPLRQAFEVKAFFDPSIAATPGMGMLEAALLALLGGLLLNLMPCVFPVLSIKALSLVRHVGRRDATLQGLAYTGGVLTTFIALAGVLIALRSGGALIGWGFQLQSPLVVALLAYLMFAIGAWLLGGFELGSRLMGIGGSLAAREGYGGSFAIGVLAVFVASPCTAPFMAGAIGFALTQDPATALAVFAALGFGLALPYLVLSISPPLQRLLPRPGSWMVRFRQLMAFPMFATAAWLVWVLARQAGDQALFLVLMGFVAIGLALWLLKSGGRVARTGGVALLVIALGLAALPARLPAADRMDERPSSALAEPFSPERLAELRAEGRPVFVNMTAAWCLTCLVNEEMVLAGRAFEEALERNGIVYLEGDWTRRDPAITTFLARFQRAGVPLYVFFPARGEPILLPQILTEGIVLAALDRDGS